MNGAGLASSAALKELASVQAFWIPAFAGKTPLPSRDDHSSEIRDDSCLTFVSKSGAGNEGLLVLDHIPDC